MSHISATTSKISKKEETGRKNGKKTAVFKANGKKLLLAGQGNCLLQIIKLQEIIDPISKQTVPFASAVDLAHLGRVYQPYGIKIEASSSRGEIYIYARRGAKIDFDAIGSDLHPFCRDGEVLLARPFNEMLYRLKEVGRMVSYQGENFIFVRK
jgi:hypothetical protein